MHIPCQRSLNGLGQPSRSAFDAYVSSNKVDNGGRVDAGFDIDRRNALFTSRLRCLAGSQMVNGHKGDTIRVWVSVSV